MNGYIKMLLKHGEVTQEIWQYVQENTVIRYVDLNGNIIGLPDVHEMTVLDPIAKETIS